MQGDSEAILTGRGGDVIKGGRGGSISLYGYGGDGGNGIEATSGHVRYSNVLPKAGRPGYDPNGNAYWGTRVVIAGTATSKSPNRADPALERQGTAYAGGTLTVKLRSEPGAFSRLFVGHAPIVNANGNTVIERLVESATTISLGNVPANGVLSYQLALDPTWTPGTTVYLQAMSIFPGGKIRRTNSVPVVVR